MPSDRLDILLKTLDQAEIDEALARHSDIGSSQEVRFCTAGDDKVRNGPYLTYKKKARDGFYVSESGACVDNMREGTVRKFAASGKCVERAQYHADKRNGLSDRFYADGVTLRERGGYVDDRPEGMFITYHPNRVVDERITYHKGQKQGRYSKTDQYGVMREWGNYKTFSYAALRICCAPPSVKFQDKRHGLFECSNAGSATMDRVRYYNATGHEDCAVSGKLQRLLDNSRENDERRRKYHRLPFVTHPGSVEECEKRYRDMVAEKLVLLSKEAPEPPVAARRESPDCARERLIDFLIGEVDKMVTLKLVSQPAQNIESAGAGQVGQRRAAGDALAIQPCN